METNSRNTESGVHPSCSQPTRTGCHFNHWNSEARTNETERSLPSLKPTNEISVPSLYLLLPMESTFWPSEASTHPRPLCMAACSGWLRIQQKQSGKRGHSARVTTGSCPQVGSLWLCFVLTSQQAMALPLKKKIHSKNALGSKADFTEYSVRIQKRGFMSHTGKQTTSHKIIQD